MKLTLTEVSHQEFNQLIGRDTPDATPEVAERVSDLCRCGHRAEIHDPCCVSACGCDGFIPRQPSVEDQLCAEQAEHTREVLRHALTKHKLESALARLAELEKDIKKSEGTNDNG